MAGVSTPAVPRRAGRLVAGALLLGSGAAALAHEAAWQRLWVPVAGAGVATASAVVAGTLAGLALGSGVGGPLADRVRRPGRLFAAAEAAGALLALAMPFLAASAVGLQRALPPDAEVSLLAFARTLVVALACALPSFALGVSLPAAVRALTAGPGDSGPLLARLYAANTAGAVAGVLASTGWAFEHVGTRATVLLASAVQGAVALLAAARLSAPVDDVGASAADARAAPPPPTAPAALAPDSGVAPRLAPLATAAALAGASGLVVEVAWMRRLAPALGTTTYAFGTVLGAFLVAIALGSWLLGPRRRDRSPGVRPAVVLALSALPVALLPPALGPVAAWAEAGLRSAIERGATDSWTLLRIRGIAAAAVVVPSAVVGSAALPWLLQAARASRAEAGTASGRLLLANGIGSAAAAAATGAWLLPALGSAACLRLAAGLYVVAAAVVAGGRARPALAAVAVAGLALAFVPFADAAVVDAVGASFDPEAGPRSDRAVLFAREGRVSTVVVRDQDGTRELWVDGKVVASAQPTDRMHLALLGHLPMLLFAGSQGRPARRVAVVGLGTGVTSHAVADHAPESLEIVELEPAVAEAATRFDGIRGGTAFPATIRFGDGRDLLARSRERYDVVTSDPIHPHVSGSAALYTVEYYRTVESRLAPGGVFCQWMSLYEADPDDLRMVLRTLAAVFDVNVFVAGQDLVMVATREPLRVDEGAMAARITGGVRESLARLGLAEPGRLLGLLGAGADRVRRFADEGPHGPRENALNTDDRTVLEFSCARAQYGNATRQNLRLLELGREDPRALLARPPRDPLAFGAGLARTERLRSAMRDWVTGASDSLDRARGVFARLAAEDADDALSASMAAECGIAYARGLVDEGREDDAAAAVEWVLALPGLEPAYRVRAAGLLEDLGLRDRAKAVARRALEDVPASPRARRIAEAR